MAASGHIPMAADKREQAREVRSHTVAGSHPAVGLTGTLVGGGCGIPLQHLPATPSIQPHRITLTAAAPQPGIHARVPQLVRMDPAEPSLAGTALQHLPDAVVAERPTVLVAQPQLGALGVRVDCPDSDVAVQGL